MLFLKYSDHLLSKENEKKKKMVRVTFFREGDKIEIDIGYTGI